MGKSGSQTWFCLFSHDRRHREYIDDQASATFKIFFKEKVPYRGGSLHLWAEISTQSLIELVLIENSPSFCNKIHK